MNLTDLQIFEMYFVDGMKEAEIADSLGLSLSTVHEVLAELENMTRSGDEWPDEADTSRR